MPPTTAPAPMRGHERSRRRLAARARRTGRNVVLLAAAVKLLDVGTATLGVDALVGLTEIVAGLGCLLAYELTD